MNAQNSAAAADFTYLDQMREQYASRQSPNQMRFYIQGIRCSKCVRTLESLPLKIKGLNNLQVDMGTNLARAHVDLEELSFSQLATEIKRMGYEPIPLAQLDSADTAARNEDRNELVRLGIAAACAGNLMTFSFAVYFGADAELARTFGWLSLALYLPVVTYVTWPFYFGAWQSLRRRALSIDLPMALASFMGFIFSTVQLYRGYDDYYFDSLSSFLFLILLARFFQKRLQRHFLKPQQLIDGLQLNRARRIRGSTWEWTPIDQIAPLDEVLVFSHEVLPFDGELRSTYGQFSLAWLTGEGTPKTYLEGAPIRAGTRVLSQEIKVRVTNLLANTEFGRILSQVENPQLNQNRIVQRSDLWAQRLLTTVFLLAVGFVALYWHVSAEEALRRALALIVLACPCAMAFGTPLALGSALSQAKRLGIFIRDACIFERIPDVRDIFFDKTGTLTDTHLTLREAPQSIPRVYQKIILSLENESVHPIAFALRAAFPCEDRLPPITDLRESSGSGVSGYLYGRFYELKAAEANSEYTTVVLCEDHRPLHTLSFSGEIKSDAGVTLNRLRGANYNLHLLSGDALEPTERVAHQLGFRTNEIHAQLRPDQKANQVHSTPHSMMVGDGVNDSLALLNAHVGVAVSGSVGVALSSAQVYLSRHQLDDLCTLIEIGKKTQQVVTRNLTLSLFYNVIGGTLALAGYINPYMAALLMPASSGVIALHTWLSGARK